MYSRLAILLSFLLFAAALFLLPEGLNERLRWCASLFSSPGVAIADVSSRVTREAVGGLPPQLTIEQRDKLLSEVANSRNEITKNADATERLRVSNRELQRILRHTTQERSHTLLPAKIIRMSAFETRIERITIDRGAYDGVQAGQAVQNLDGVIGIIEQSSARQAVVRLFASTDFSMPVQVLSRNVSGLLENRNGVLYMTSAMGVNFATVQNNDRVYTTDLGSENMYPGLTVGKVLTIQRGEDGAPIYRIEPAASLTTEEFVLVSIPSGH